MHVISQKALRDFAKEHPDAEKPLSAWLKLARRGNFRNLAELKKTFASTDLVPAGSRALYVFNIGGNKYRLTAAIHFNSQKLFVRNISTHFEYDIGRWQE